MKSTFLIQKLADFSSISFVSDACGWFLAFIVRNIGTALKYSPTEPLSLIAIVVGYYCSILFLMRPLVIWIVSFTPKNRPIEENQFIAILCIVMVNGFFAEYIGEHARFGAFVFGVDSPNGTTLGAIITQKLEVICTGLLLPIFCAISGLKVQISSIVNMTTAKIELIIFAGYFGKFIGTILPSIYFKIPFKESLTLTLIMCCKGIMEIAVYGALYDTQVTQETTKCEESIGSISISLKCLLQSSHSILSKNNTIVLFLKLCLLSYKSYDYLRTKKERVKNEVLLAL